MILKILPRHSPTYASLIDYILKETKVQDEQELVFTHNLRSEDMEGWTREFLENESFRKHNRAGQVYMYHDIISFSANEQPEAFTKEMLADIARQYISLRGNEGVFLGTVHNDKKHVHIHFVTSGTAYRTGKAMRLSKEKLHDLKVHLQEYHKDKYPELTESLCAHGKGREYVTDREWQMKHRNRRAMLKEELKAKVQACFRQAKTQNEFLSLLRDQDLHHYERSGTVAGIMHEDLKFRFSRLDLSKEQFNALPLDRTDEQKALEQIAELRERGRDISREGDMEQPI